MKTISRFLWTTLVLILITVSSFAQTTYHVNSAKLNLRESASLDADIIRVLVLNEEVEFVEKTGEWAYIKTPYGDGYVAWKYLANGNAPFKAQSTETTVLICVSKSAVAYHKYECRGLNRCTHTISRVTISNAKDRGYRECQICY